MSDKKNTIGRFEIIEKIGEGPIGAVYKALDPVIRRTVAVKVIKLYTLEETATFAEVFEKIYRVVRTSTALNHPNICVIYDLSEEKKIPFTTMEFVDGHDLAWLLQNRHQFKRGEVLNIFQQTCDALDFAHRKNVIHQDLKPTNMLLTSDLHVKITDFGIAGLDEIAAAQTKKLLSIPYYISPEQALGEKVTPASDLFSLGTIMFQVLSGQLPFPGTSAANVIMMIARDNPIVPNDLEKSGISREDWESFFSIAIAKSPSQRFRTAREMFDALSAILPPGETSYYPYTIEGPEPVAPEKLEKTFVNDSPTVMLDASQLAGESAPVSPDVTMVPQPASAFDLLEESMPSSAPTMMLSREEAPQAPAPATVMIEAPKFAEESRPPEPPPTAPPAATPESSAPTQMISMKDLTPTAPPPPAPPPAPAPAPAPTRHQAAEMATMMIEKPAPAPEPPPQVEDASVTMRPTPSELKEAAERKEQERISGSHRAAAATPPPVPPAPPAPAPPPPPVSRTAPPKPAPPPPAATPPVQPAAPPPEPAPQESMPPAPVAATQAQAGSSMKTLGILAVIIALLIGIAGAAFFLIPKLTKEETPAPQPEVPKPITVEPRPEPVKPTEPQPELPVSGKITINSEPAGATVILDEVEKGVTPLEVPDVPFGTHIVKISLKGYQDVQQEITLSAEATEAHLPVTMEKAAPQVGSLVVESEPAGAFIIINNRAQGTTPKTLGNQRAGKVTVTLKKDGFRDYTETVRVTAGKSVSLRANLEEIPKPQPEPVKPVKPVEPDVKTGDLVTMGPGVTPPKALKKPFAKYPDAARRQRLEGVVGLSILISETGKVLEVKVVKSANPILDQAAVDAVQQWVYEPATKSGVKVKIWQPVSMSFQSGR